MKFEAVSALGPDFLPDLNALWHVVSPQGEPITERALELKFKLGSGSQLFVCIDEVSGRLVGQVWVTIINTSSPIRAKIDDVATLKEFEHLGIATELMTMAERYAREMGAKEFELTSASHRVEAIALYEKLGYKKRETNVMTKAASLNPHT